MTVEAPSRAKLATARYPDPDRPAWLRYGTAVLLCGAALLLTGAFWPFRNYLPQLLPFLAVLAAGWFGGGGPSLLCVTLSTLSIAYFFYPPVHSFAISDVPSAIRLGAFVLVGVGSSAAFNALTRIRRRRAALVEEATAARRAAEQTTRELEALLEKRRDAERKLQSLAAIVESSEDAIIAKDLEGRIMTWNAGAERTFGYRGEEVLGKPVSILMPPEHRGDMSEILSRIRRGERVKHYESVRIRKNGERFPVSLSVSPIKDSEGGIVGAAKICRDITEQKQMQAERERLYREAQEAAKAREDFLSMAGHELRTPLTTLQFQFHTLGRRLTAGQLDKAGELLERSRGQLERLVRLTEELLDVTRITSGRLDLESEEADLSAITREAAERFRDSAVRAGCEMRIEAPPGIKGTWDRSRLDQVVTNLVSNAVKFGKGMPVEIRVEPDTTHARICVRDYGIGMSDEDRSKIFDRFERAVSRRSYGGMGLGLWISRQIVEAHGGKIEVESEPGKGSTFWVDLPLDHV
jgi:PAS domain S-box-containing protein